jgi:Holliday junction resolvasome RuvABC endonuclease subunit
VSVNVTAIDLSLTSTGVASAAGLRRIVSKGTADADLHTRAARLGGLAWSIVDAVVNDIRALPDLVVIEGPSYGSRHGSAHDRSGLWWLVVDLLRAHDIPVAEVAPQSRAKYATGNGGAGKDRVLAAAIKRYPDADIDGNDVCDAHILRAMGLRHLGEPLEKSLPQTHLGALRHVHWPEVIAE